MTATLIRDIEQAPMHPAELLKFIERPRDLNVFDPYDRVILAEAEFAAKVLERPVRSILKELGVAPPIAGGAGMTQGYNELYYVSLTNGTQLDTYTTERSLIEGLKHIIFPAGSLNQIEKSIKLTVRGRVGSTGTPTFTFSCRFINSTTFAAGGGIGVSTAAITTGSGITLRVWKMEVDIVVRSVGIGGGSNTTLSFLGEVSGPSAFASPFAYTMPTDNTAFTASLDSSVTQYLYPSAACGTNNGSNLIRSEIVKCYVEN